MVELILARGVHNPHILGAMRRVPRHQFVPFELWDCAYDDRPLPIAREQTISQPYIVAFMCAAANVRPGLRVLEIGTGSGYQAALLSNLGARVHSMEIVPELLQAARRDLDRLGYGNVELRLGDGALGWPEAAPFDAILVAASPRQVPRGLVEQLADGGRLVIPVGERGDQTLEVHQRRADSVIVHATLPVRFVPMTGLAQDAGSGVS